MSRATTAMSCTTRCSARTNATKLNRIWSIKRPYLPADGMKYTFTLRRGLRWHDVSRYCRKTTLSRRSAGEEGPFRPAPRGTYGNDNSGRQEDSPIEPAERFGPMLDALAKPSSNVPFMMPARIASMLAEDHQESDEFWKSPRAVIMCGVRATIAHRFPRREGFSSA
jgi:hypothetical protein